MKEQNRFLEVATEKRKRGRPSIDIGATSFLGGIRYNKRARKPMVLESPIDISHMSFGALSKEVKIALAKGSAMAKTACAAGKEAFCRRKSRRRASTYLRIFPTNTA